MKITLHEEGFDGLVVDLGDVGRQAMKEGKQIVSHGSLKIKNDWRDRWQGHSTIAHLPSAINYDVDVDGPLIVGEIGPLQERLQGNMAHLIEFGNTEYGTVNNAPIPGGQPALDAEEPRFIKAVEDLAAKLLEGG